MVHADPHEFVCLAGGKPTDHRLVEGVAGVDTVFPPGDGGVALVNGRSGRRAWWVLNLNVVQLEQRNPGPEVTVPTLSAFSSGLRRSGIYCQVGWNCDGLGGRSVRFDVAGGGRYCVYATNVDVGLLSGSATPLEQVEYGAPSRAVASGAAFVTWTSVSASLAPQAHPIELRYGHFTVQRFVPSGESAIFVDVPEDATHVQIFEDGATLTDGPWRFVGVTGGYGQIPLVDGASAIVSIPGAATQMQVVGTEDADRVYLLVFDQKW